MNGAGLLDPRQREAGGRNDEPSTPLSNLERNTFEQIISDNYGPEISKVTAGQSEKAELSGGGNLAEGYRNNQLSLEDDKRANDANLPEISPEGGYSNAIRYNPLEKSGMEDPSAVSDSQAPSDEMEDLAEQLRQNASEPESGGEYRRPKRFAKIKAFSEKKRTRRILATFLVGGSLAGGAGVVGVVPVALQSILGDASSQYSDYSSEQIVKKAFNHYFKEDVLKPKCLSVAGNRPELIGKCNAGSHPAESSILKRARGDFLANKYDELLAKKGIGWEVDPNSSGATVIVTKNNIPVSDIVSSGGIDYDNFDIFEMGDHEFSKYIRVETKKLLAQETLWKRMLIRGPTMRAMQVRTGGTGCIFFCKTRDKINNAKAMPKKAFAKAIRSSIVLPSADLLNGILDCVIDGGTSCSSTKIREEAIAKFSEATARYFSDDVAGELNRVFEEAFGDKGIKQAVADLTAEKITRLIGTEFSSKAITGPLAVAMFIYKMGKFVDSLVEGVPKMIRARNFASVAIAASTFFVLFSEYKRGAIPLADVGSMLISLAGMGQSRVFANMFMGSTGEGSKPYECAGKADGVLSDISAAFTPSEIPVGELTCAAFTFDYIPDILNNAFLKTISDVYDKINAVPGVSAVSEAFDKVSSLLSGFGVLDGILSSIPFLDKIEALIGDKIGEVQNYLVSNVFPPIVDETFATVESLTSLGGARVFDAMVGGLSATGQYIMPRDEMGGGELSDADLASLDYQIASDRREATQYASVYDRFFNLDSTTSIIGPSLLANFSASAYGASSVANLFNPMQNLSLAFNGFSSSQTFAAGGSTANIMRKTMHTPVRGYSLAKLKQISAADLPDTDSQECKTEMETFKKQIEDRSDEEGKSDVLGYGIPDGDGSGVGPCLLTDTSLKALTTINTGTNDFPVSGSPAGGSSPASTTTPVTGGVGSSTSAAVCPAGSTVMKNPADGTDKFKTYNDGAEKTSTLCSIDSLAVNAIDSDGSESTPGTEYYIPDSRGKAIIDSSKAADVIRMVADAKKEGVDLVAIGTFRTHQHQEDAYSKSSTGGYAKPGYSRHETGMAIDFLDDNRNSTANCADDMEGSRCVSRGNAVWDWLDKNAAKYGYKQLERESWHWSPDGL